MSAPCHQWARNSYWLSMKVAARSLRAACTAVAAPMPRLPPVTRRMRAGVGAVAGGDEVKGIGDGGDRAAQLELGARGGEVADDAFGAGLAAAITLATLRMQRQASENACCLS